MWAFEIMKDRTINKADYAGPRADYAGPRSAVSHKSHDKLDVGSRLQPLDQNSANLGTWLQKD